MVMKLMLICSPNHAPELDHFSAQATGRIVTILPAPKCGTIHWVN